MIIDEFIAYELVRDQHGPSFWGELTDAGREMYIKRFQDAWDRADLARREYNGDFD